MESMRNEILVSNYNIRRQINNKHQIQQDVRRKVEYQIEYQVDHQVADVVADQVWHGVNDEITKR